MICTAPSNDGLMSRSCRNLHVVMYCLQSNIIKFTTSGPPMLPNIIVSTDTKAFGRWNMFLSRGKTVKSLWQIISGVSGNPVRARPGRTGGRSAAAGSASGGRQRVHLGPGRGDSWQIPPRLGWGCTLGIFSSHPPFSNAAGTRVLPKSQHPRSWA